MLGTTTTNASGMWAFTGIADGNYDVYVQNGTQVIVYKANSRIPYSLNAASIADDAVITAKIANLAVTTAKLNDLAVTNGKLAAASLTANKFTAVGANAGLLGPPSGGDAVPTFRALALADLPALLTGWVEAVGTTANPTTTSTTNVAIPEMTASNSPLVGSKLLALMTVIALNNTAGQFVNLSLACDLIAGGANGILQSASANEMHAVTLFHLWTVASAALHTITGQWSVSANTGQCYGVLRQLLVVEIRK